MKDLLPIIDPPISARSRIESTPGTRRRANKLPCQKDLGSHAEDFIDDHQLVSLLERPSERDQVRDVIAKSLDKQPLSVAESALLLNATEPELQHEIFEAARRLKRDVYGRRIVLFAPFVHRQLLCQ